MKTPVTCGSLHQSLFSLEINSTWVLLKCQVQIDNYLWVCYYYSMMTVSEERLRYIAGEYENHASIASLCAATGHGQHVVQKAIRKYGTPRQSKIGKNNTDRFLRLDATSAYWLGFMAADGHIRHVPSKYRYELVIEVNRKDELHIDKLASYIGFVSKTRRKRDDCIIYSFTSKQLVQNLMQWLNPNNKTELDNFSSFPEKWKKDFIRGYFDGDGHRRKSGFGITSCPGTLLPICEYISEAIGESYRLYDKAGGRAKDARFNKAAAEKFFKEFDGPIRLERKWSDIH